MRNEVKQRKNEARIAALEIEVDALIQAYFATTPDVCGITADIVEYTDRREAISDCLFEALERVERLPKSQSQFDLSTKIRRFFKI